MTMRGSHLSLEERAKAAVERIKQGAGAMRIPAEATDPDIVITAQRSRIQTLEAALKTLLTAGVDLKGAIHAEPDMSGRLKGLHISPVRGAEPLRVFLAQLAESSRVLSEETP